MLALEIALDAESLGAAQERIEAFLKEEGASGRVAYKVRLVLDEMIANLMMHGRFESLPPPATVELGIDAGAVRLCLEDAALPFDPRLDAAPVPPRVLEDAELGGLGLPLVRRMADIRDYRRLPEGRNRTVFHIAEG
jgi:anti-sigma regulatory factor (Ser/Thr protein kinase)